MKKILIIEDNDEVRENLEEILDLYGYDTETAENGKIGVERLIVQKIIANDTGFVTKRDNKILVTIFGVM